jgi:indole-3-glycerol phosphate synthase
MEQIAVSKGDWPVKALETTHILARIIEAKRQRLRRAKMRVPEAIIKRMAHTSPRAPSFAEALQNGQRVRVIAEVKKASPSKGVFRQDFDVSTLSDSYTSAGASAISVVTEEDFFQGDLGWVGQIRKTSPLPILRKDFIFDPFQVYETRASGASAILLIVAMLRSDELRELLSLATDIKLDVLVEVHDDSELMEALEADAKIIGVNNRDLKTFKVDVETSVRLGKQIPNDRIFVVESGIHGRAEIDSLLGAGADAFLIGEHFLTAPDPGAALRGLV